MSKPQQSPINLNININQSQTFPNLNNLQSVKTFTCTFLQSDKEIFQSQHNKLIQFISSMESVIAQILLYKHQSHTISTLITEEIAEVQTQIKEHKEQSCESNQETIHKQIRLKLSEYDHEWKERKSLSKSINMDKFTTVHIQDRKSKANELFKLILLVFYSQPIAKYYWPNFKRQAFINDGGNDLKERLGRMKSALLQQEQKAQIKHFLGNFNSIYTSKQLSKVTQQIEKIRDIVKLYLKGYEQSLEIKSLNQKIELEKDKRVKGQENIEKWTYRVEALNGRLSMVQQYTYALNTLKDKLIAKISSYKSQLLRAQNQVKRLEEAKSLISQIQSFETQKQELCDCLIM